MKRSLLLCLLLACIALAPVRAQYATYGSSLALSEHEVFIGQPMSLSDPGTVFVFRKDDGGWREVSRLQAAAPRFGDGFGQSLALDGGTLLVGTVAQAPFPGAPPNTVYVFERDAAGTWHEAGRLEAPEGAGGFGVAVALAGDVALVGAHVENGMRGAVHVYRRGPDGAWTHQTTLGGDDTAAGDRFGTALAFDGTHALVGAPGHDGGRGAVHVYRYDPAGGTWHAAGRLTGGQDADEGAHLGAAVALAGDLAFAGAPLHTDGAGRVARFARHDERGWVLMSTLAPGTDAPAHFGAALILAGGNLWVGAPGTPEQTGHVYVFDANTGVPKHTLHDPARQTGNQFGRGLAAAGRHAVAGAPEGDYGLGRAVLYERQEDGTWHEAAVLLKETGTPPSITGGQVNCTDGEAAAFTCENVDLLSFLSVEDLGGERGVFVNDLWGWTDPETGREYALVGKNVGLAFIDVSDPTRPVYLGELPRTEGVPASLWRDVKVYRNHAFIVADGAGPHGMQVFDLTRLRSVENPPVTFTPDAHYTRIHSSHNIVINEETGFAFAVGNRMGGETCGGGLHMIDIREPKNPQFAGCFSHAGTGNNGTGGTHDAQCVVYRGPDADYQGREICFGSNETALSIADVTDKANPKAIARATYPNVAYAHQGWLTEDHRYFYLNDEGDEMSGLVPGTRTVIWDVTDLDDPQFVGAYIAPVPSVDHNLYVKGNLIFESNYVSGLRILDITNREQPVEIGFFDTVPETDAPVFNGSWSNYPFFKSGIIVVTSMREGVFILKRKDVDI
ncbi:choice-of-anchor B family protein [Rhodocaloribacter litoris]|uniref:choice-of-anchor B family protein n=1 Tax=Rhodocaloribacter litoris TaxID=2558931 RepID=UPI001E47461F|nr:choice-of-anchor B family protein [Rhodocaloribacter litoris]QXD13955.1 choice-of-anchor B family protein [Rhodocaloribacter litoris]